MQEEFVTKGMDEDVTAEEVPPFQPHTLHLTLYTLHPTPYTLH